MPINPLTDAQVAQFHEDGYLMIPGMFPAEEMDLLLKIARADRTLANAGGMEDAAGGKSKIWLTTKPEDDIYSAISFSHRLADPLSQLMNDRVMFYHHKMMLKEPRVGGAWEWHQDYGYWYGDGFLFPDMISCMIPVDRASKANGCLQVLKGSHKLGRIGHGRVGGQTGADPNRLPPALDRLELVYCEMEPGTGLIFHANLLHRSDQNKSEHSRWSLICCYTTEHNPSVHASEREFVNCKRVEPRDDGDIMTVGQRQWERMEQATEG